MGKLQKTKKVPGERYQCSPIQVPELDKHHKVLMTFYKDALNNCSRDKTKEKEYFYYIGAKDYFTGSRFSRYKVG